MVPSPQNQCFKMSKPVSLASSPGRFSRAASAGRQALRRLEEASSAHDRPQVLCRNHLVSKAHVLRAPFSGTGCGEGCFAPGEARA